MRTTDRTHGLHLPTPLRHRHVRDEAGRLRVALVVVTLVVVLGVGLLVKLGAGPLPDPPGCSADVAGVSVDISTEQGQNAGLIAAIGVRRGLPARAVSIALATAFQESKLRNLTAGDRDSLGLFQQRPSQGWGTRTQILDPVHAINAFYDALEKIDGYEDMRITEAAQAVQHSGYPEAYEEHADGARALASALTGWSPARFTCVVGDPTASHQDASADGLTPRAEAVRQDLVRAFGPVDTNRVSSTSFEVGVGSGGQRRGWALASYLVSQAARLDIASVAVDGHGWATGRESENGWETTGATARRAPADGSVLVSVVTGG